METSLPLDALAMLSSNLIKGLLMAYNVALSVLAGNLSLVEKMQREVLGEGRELIFPIPPERSLSTYRSRIFELLYNLRAFPKWEGGRFFLLGSSIATRTQIRPEGGVNLVLYQKPASRQASLAGAMASATPSNTSSGYLLFSRIFATHGQGLASYLIDQQPSLMKIPLPLSPAEVAETNAFRDIDKVLEETFFSPLSALLPAYLLPVRYTLLLDEDEEPAIISRDEGHFLVVALAFPLSANEDSSEEDSS